MSWFWPDFVQLTSTETDFVLNASMGDIKLLERTTPTPISGVGQLYAKSDNILYYLDPNGNETAISSGAVPGLAVVGLAGSGADFIAGSNNADVAINAAMQSINIAIGGTVVLLSGTFNISNLLQLPSNVNLVGAGIDNTIIKSINGYNPSTSVYGTSGRRVMMIGYNSTAISNNVVEGITWDANVQNIPGLTGQPAHRTWWIQSAINFTVRKCKFLDGINWTVFFNLSDRVWVHNNIVLGGYSSTYNQNDGIHFRNSSHYYIYENYIDTSAGGGTSGDDAIAFVVDADAVADMAYFEIHHNIINGSGSRGIIGDIATSFNIRNGIILGNSIENTQQAGIKLYTANSQTGQYFSIKINANDLYNIGINGSDAGHGIFLDQDYGTNRQMFTDIQIQNNTIKNLVYTSGYGINVQGQITGLNIIGNIMRGMSGLGGMRLGNSSNPVSDYMVTGNTIDVSAGVSGVIGINLLEARKGTITGNEFTGHTTGTTYGIYVAGDATHTTFLNNISNNQFNTWVNGIAEINAGANPNPNQYFNNQFNTVTTKYTILGASSMIFGQDSANFGWNVGAPLAAFHFVPLAQSGGPNATSGEVFRLDGATMTDSSTAGSGTATAYVANSIGQQTLASTNTVVTTTDAMTLYIAGGVVKGTNDTVTNSHAVYIAAGAVGAQTNSYGLTVNAQTGAGTNYAAQFIGGNVGIGTATPSSLFSVGSSSQFQVTSSGIVGTYNNIATAGAGVPYVISSPGLPSTQTANYQVLTYTPPSTFGALYIVYGAITTTGSTNTGTLQMTLDYKDAEGTTHTADVIPLVDAAGAVATTKTGASKEYHSIPWLITTKNDGTAIVLKIVITGSVSYIATGSVIRVA